MTAPSDMTDDEAEAEIDRLWHLHPDVVDAVLAVVEIASPLAGPQRKLAEIQAIFDAEGWSPTGFLK